MAKEQAFLPNGTLVPGVAFDRHEFDDLPQYVMGTIHVWVWRRTQGGVEVLLQQRSLRKKTHPGLLDISAAGHIDVGELPIETAARECEEELGMAIDTQKLLFAFSIRKTNVSNVIATVYLYEVQDDFSPVFQDGEVEAVFWKPLATFEEMIKQPEKNSLAHHGQGYFTLLIERLKLQ